MLNIACDGCGVPFQIYPYRLKVSKHHFCTKKCSDKNRGMFLTGPPSVPKDKFEQVRQTYEQQNKTRNRIALEFDCSVAQVERWAKKYKWVKFKRTTGTRTTYRKVATAKIGRSLSHGEHIHHVDGDITHNVPTNLHVFSDARTHARCHASLERIAFILYRKGLIEFDFTNGVYRLSRERKILNG